MKKISRSTLIIAIVTSIVGCKKTDTYSSPSINDYMPLYANHSLTYQLDSTIFTYYGTIKEVHSYIAKDSIEGTLTDNTGRPSWRVARYYRDARDITAWHPVSTYMITPLANTIELVENNLRFVKLTMPIQDMTNWSGNGYLPYDPYGFDFAHPDYNTLSGWNYIYQDIGKKAVINGFPTFDSNTITVVDSSPDSSNLPPHDPTVFGSRTSWTEQYGKGAGLIYRDIIFEEYQPPNIYISNPYYIGFELKMSIIKYQ